MTIYRPAISPRLLKTPIIAVLRADDAKEYPAVIEALVAGGIQSIELTLSTARVFDELPKLTTEFGPTVQFGVGTITTLDQARSAIDSGAGYLVTPIMNNAITEFAVTQRTTVFPGGLTPTELYSGWVAGASAVKVFPATTVGPGYLSQLRGPFPDIQVIPSGGVDVDSAADWIRSGALAVSLGGPLIADAFNGGDLRALTERARRLCSVIEDARLQ